MGEKSELPFAAFVRVKRMINIKCFHAANTDGVTENLLRKKKRAKKKYHRRLTSTTRAQYEHF